MDSRAAIINAAADRQAIYKAKRDEAARLGNYDERFDRMSMAVEVCAYVADDVLRALGLEPATNNVADELLIEKVPA